MNYQRVSFLALLQTDTKDILELKFSPRCHALKWFNDIRQAQRTSMSETYREKAQQHQTFYVYSQ